MPADRASQWWASGPEWLLALVASLACLGWLGSTELWGKREQRAAAEALDTVNHGHWLVGSIQGRPRLEKPPLPRWINAALMLASGRRDEAIVRLPNALAAMALVGLVYFWGRSIGGRAVGLAGGFALAATPFFLVEMRQAGNDGLLALMATLGLISAAWRVGLEPDDEPGSRRWSLLCHGAIGLGFLCKGPVILLWVGLPLVGLLATQRRVRSGLRLLIDPLGLMLLTFLLVAWPVAVAVRYPESVGVWWLEIGQKTGALGVEHGNARGSILVEALGTTLPWTPLVLGALLGPIRHLRARRIGLEVTPTSPALALAWWSAFAPLAVLGLWDVAKPSYYLPALPAVAVLVGAGWIDLARRARLTAGGVSARWALQLVWSSLFAITLAAPVVVHEIAPRWFGLSLASSLILGLATLASARAWHLGRDSASLATLASGLVAVSLIGYGVIAPTQNSTRGHRALTLNLVQTLPPGATAWFLDDLDEALWFYGPRLDLQPVPPVRTDTPATNRGHTLRASATLGQTRAEAIAARTRAAVDQLTAWANAAGPGAYLLVRGKLLDRLGPALPPTFTPVYRETGVERNEVVLLRVRPSAEVATLPAQALR